ncbi:hypothetical protein HDU93_003550 [Gonapodya sp. JEL0774]|nr:hypothetical protein HDU93_003550 [Gonapodya sp. JEL0774]
MSADRQPLSWTPPTYPSTTIENDGTAVNRYDVRKTLAYISDVPGNVNNVYMLYYITTGEGKKFHLNTNLGLISGRPLAGTFMSFNDLTTMTTRGASTLVPGSANKEILNIRSGPQSIIAPEDGDQWTGSQLLLDFQGIKLDATVHPTGTNFYYGGGGGIQLVPASVDPGMAISPHGWSWYWANPTTRIAGTLEVDGTVHKIDPDHSFALFERQWGNFHIGAGYWALWLWLETGEVIISWGMAPTLDGRVKTSFASVWHPNGIHEMIPVGPETRGSDVSTSSVTGLKYFNRVLLDLPARNASFTINKWFRDGELTPTPPTQQYITISESYSEGVGRWNGKDVKFFGHVEQLSTLK